jgi:hypothetical protein
VTKAWLDSGWASSLIAVIGLGLGIWRLKKPARVSWKIATSGTEIEVCLGDLFQQDGVRLIPVNNYFDSKLGSAVAPKTLHGQLIARGFGGHPDAFDRSIEQQLAQVSSVKTDRVEGKDRAYPVGTTAMVEADKARYLLFALSTSDPVTNKAVADVPQMFTALAAAWTRGRNESNGETLNVPLVGTGQSGVDLPTREALNAVILSIITANREKRLADRVRVVLFHDRDADLDLRDVRKYWSEK